MSRHIAFSHPAPRRLSLAVLCAIATIASAPALAAGIDDADQAPIPTVTVTGTTEASNSFAGKKASVMKGFDDVRDIPQPVTVLTREFLDDRLLLDLTDVLRNTPGVTVDYTDSERVNYFSRGFGIDALQIDGLTMTQGGSIFVQPDTAVLDHVEVLRGASGMLRGSGNPSAAVNLVRKRPTKAVQGSLGVTLGSWDRRRIEGDISGPLNAAGTVRGRLVAVKDKKEFFQDARKEDREVMYGVIEADIGPRTLVTASLQHTDLDATGSWGGLPANFNGTQLALPTSTYLGAEWNRWNRYNDQAMAEVLHKFDSGWQVKGSYAWTGLHMKTGGFKQTSFSRSSTTNPYLANVSTSYYTGDTSNQRTFSLVADGPFTLLGREHHLIVGADGQTNDTIGTSGFFNLGAVNGIDIRNWNPYTTMAEPSLSDPRGTAYAAANNSTRQKGVFATTRLSITEPLSFLLGARASWWEYEVPTQPASNYKIEREITPYAGITYDVTKQITAYASYTEIFSPQNYKDASGKLLAPVQGNDVEAGFKGEFFGGRLTSSLSLFRINNEGKAAQDASSPNPCLPYYPTSNCYIDGGKQRSEGWEIEVSGEALPGLQVTGGYTNTRTRYIADSSLANVGQPLRSIDPRHLLRLFASYRPDGVLQGWNIGGGVQAQSDGFVRAGTVTSAQGGYAVYNALVGYRFNKQYTAQLNVNNLFDKQYLNKYTPSGFSNYYADPRSVQLTLRATF
jgi:outer membrane receptor for ferric coprogen and ferric-rhodotorulic acid